MHDLHDLLASELRAGGSEHSQESEDTPSLLAGAVIQIEAQTFVSFYHHPCRRAPERGV